jgi:hypothetical protein
MQPTEKQTLLAALALCAAFACGRKFESHSADSVVNQLIVLLLELADKHALVISYWRGVPRALG